MQCVAKNYLESGDDYLCDKDAVEKWYPINWDGTA